jgi:hypothetical protein
MDFVIGHPRSGTMFVSRLLDAARPGAAAHELLAARAPESLAATTGYYERSAGADELRQLLSRYGEGPRIDCNHKLTWIVPLLRERWPGARILHLVRDPRANVRSCVNLDYYGELAGDPRYQTDPERNAWLRTMPRVRRQDWDRLTQLERNCVFWSETHRLALEAGEPYLRVRIEDLESDDAVTAATLAFFDLPPLTAPALAQLRAARVNLKLDEKVEVRSLKGMDWPVFSAWTPEEQEQLRQHCGPLARRFGYDL